MRRRRVEQAKANLTDKQAEAARRQKLPDIAASIEETQNYITQAQIAQAVYDVDLATLAQARVNLARTRIVSPGERLYHQPSCSGWRLRHGRTAGPEHCQYRQLLGRWILRGNAA